MFNNAITIMKPGILTFLLLVICFLISCDPARVLVIKASGRQGSSVKVYGQASLLPASSRSDTTRIVISIPSAANPTTRETQFYYGIGTWGGEEAIRDFSERIDSIVFISEQEKTIMSDRAEVQNYLRKHRHGFFRRILTIKAK